MSATRRHLAPRQPHTLHHQTDLYLISFDYLLLMIKFSSTFRTRTIYSLVQREIPATAVLPRSPGNED